MRYLFAIIFSVVSLCASAQDETTAVVANTVKFGYISYRQVFQEMPEHAIAAKQIEDLKAKYEDEAKRVEDEFNKKYEEFLDTQSDLPKSILQKRQGELQELLAKNIEFKAESRRLLAQAEKDAYAPLHAKLQQILKVVGQEDGYAFIINIDDNACPFINPEMGTDVTKVVIKLLQELQ